MPIIYRSIQPLEYAFLKEMLYEALFVPPGKAKFSKAILEEPAIKKYVANWHQQKEDIAIVAVVENNLIGAIWGRKFRATNKGYGYVDDNTPEISMAVKAAFRNKGIGTALLAHIASVYRRMGIQQISLSVDQLNPAKALYERNGYEIYKVEATAFTMLKHLKTPS